MSETGSDHFDVTLALAALDVNLDAVEGVLLTVASQDDAISVSSLADATDINPQTANDILLQLRRANCATQHPQDTSQYYIDAPILREVFRKARQADQVITRYEQRQPTETTVRPLITVPDDAAFSDFTPSELGMEWLLPMLVRMIKRASERIIILTPFLEGTGLNRLRGPLVDALEEGVEIVIVTRYLNDIDAINHGIVTDFWTAVRDAGVNTKLLSVYDYTAWDEGTPANNRTQDGATPKVTLHSKLLLVDSIEAYVGSANVTNYGLSKYLELGVHISGPAVEAYTDICNRLLTSEHATEWTHT
ncbi:phospholipase D-like domain-containing protein [Halorubrum sp. AS12]|uniref:phospholipase D-like domain-containing protein n=1 Tax=Halorubrum sp. AS12 TaxID=3409687 RepID=UPI003DA78CAA